jgi:hypothetical protein
MRRVIWLFLFAAMLAGCGASGPTPSGPGPGGPPDLVTAAYRYAGCMRQHGVPVPDPQVTNHGDSQSIRQVVRVSNSPAFKAAQKACAGILPGPQDNPTQTAQQRHRRLLGLLSFARCMRSHGVPSFPDPDAEGQISQPTLANAGIDIHLRSVLQAAQTCVPASQGAVTPAAIARAVNRGG